MHASECAETIWINDMDCAEFRRRFAGYDGKATLEVMQTDEYEKWCDHFHDCAACSDWGLGQRVMSWGHDPAAHPCVHMAYRALQTCEQHADRAECPDLLIEHEPDSGSYFLIKPGARAPIAFCPWCGVRLRPAGITEGNPA